MNQRERFEAAWRRAYPNMHPIVLDHSALGYRESWVDKMWQGFQAGEASGFALAAKVCKAQQQEPECPEIAQYCADEIEALLTQDGASKRVTKADKTKVYRFWVGPVMITKGNGKFHYFIKRSDYLKAQRKIAKLEAEISNHEIRALLAREGA